MKDILFSYTYTNSADVVTLAVCTIIGIFICSSFTAKKLEMTLLKVGTACVAIAAVCSILFHHFLEIGTLPVWAIHVTRYLSLSPLIITYCIFAYYLILLLKPSELVQRIVRICLYVLSILFLLSEALVSYYKVGFYIDENGAIHENFLTDPFRFAYIILTVFCMYMLISRRKKLITKNFYCLISVAGLMYIIMAIEDFIPSTTCLAFTFSMPIVTVLFMYHYNAYDTDTGMLDYNAMRGYIDELTGKTFSILCLELPSVDEQRLTPLSEDFFHFNEQFFTRPMIFHASQKFILISPYSTENKILTKLPDVLKAFDKLHEKYMLEYRIVYAESTDSLTNAEDYLNYLDDILSELPPDTVHISSGEEVSKYIFKKKILSELKDIAEKQDLYDERIIVYAQPVLQLENNHFTTAEALMRMKLKDIGMVFPDQFIGLAEEHGYIHILSKIILNKTCMEAKRLLNEGYHFSRISVNFAISELRGRSFCNDVLSIISSNNVPYDKIAIELTESRDTSDFELVKSIMKQLGDVGIKFYLDDFGTGYSNFERIIQLPIDIIKFDRSLTISSSKDEKNHHMVNAFSDMFKSSGYQILFEGIEDETDEDRCKNMNARYLQGYKYSRPIPIEALRNFFSQQ